MINFTQQQTEIKNYIQTKTKELLTELNLDDFDAYIDDFVDLDAYKKPKQLFFSFDDYNFEALTNESEAMEFSFTLYLTFIGSKPSDLKDKMLVYTAAIHEMFDRSGNNLGGIFDYGLITNTHFYNAAESDRCKKVAEITFTMNKEE